MKRVIVYPNNSVTIDGEDVDWDEKILQSYGIKLNRVTSGHGTIKTGEVFIVGIYHFTVYPNHVLSKSQFQHRFTYRGQLLRKKHGKDYFLKKRGQNDKDGQGKV